MSLLRQRGERRGAEDRRGVKSIFFAQFRLCLGGAFYLTPTPTYLTGLYSETQPVSLKTGHFFLFSSWPHHGLLPKQCSPWGYIVSFLLVCCSSSHPPPLIESPYYSSPRMPDCPRSSYHGLEPACSNNPKNRAAAAAAGTLLAGCFTSCWTRPGAAQRSKSRAN